MLVVAGAVSVGSECIQGSLSTASPAAAAASSVLCFVVLTHWRCRALATTKKHGDGNGLGGHGRSLYVA